MRRIIIAVSFVLAGSLAAGCGTTTTGSSSSGAASSGASSSNRSSMACGHWANIMGDVKAGILTDSELRTKVSEVRDSASSSTVRSAATQLLAGVTSKKKDQILTGYAALESACK